MHNLTVKLSEHIIYHPLFFGSEPNDNYMSFIQVSIDNERNEIPNVLNNLVFPYKNIIESNGVKEFQSFLWFSLNSAFLTISGHNYMRTFSCT